MSWQPGCSIDTLKLRARLLASIRHYFEGQGVLEVTTPVVARTTVTAPYIDSVRLDPDQVMAYLQTSPEYFMKRLLAAGSGSIYQIGPAFRQGEAGRYHNPEFTMLEWYRVGFTLEALMNDVESLARACGLFIDQDFERLTYRRLFQSICGFDPMTADVDTLLSRTSELCDIHMDKLRSWPTGEVHTNCLDLLFSICIQRTLIKPSFVVDYPADQAALARIDRDADGFPVAQRFELFAGGVELANGYDELRDAEEMRLRMTRDNNIRRSLSKTEIAADEHLLAAMEHGLPEVAGVAVGIDRLVLLKANLNNLDEAIPFSVART